MNDMCRCWRREIKGEAMNRRVTDIGGIPESKREMISLSSGVNLDREGV